MNVCFLSLDIAMFVRKLVSFLEILLSYYSYCVFRKISNSSILTKNTFHTLFHFKNCFLSEVGIAELAFNLSWL